MRVRYMTYSDYGLSKEKVNLILEYCQTTKNLSLIQAAAIKANEVIAPFLVRCVTEKVSYEKLNEKYNWIIPYEKNDFYAYRKKMLAILYKLLQQKTSNCA